VAACPEREPVEIDARHRRSPTRSPLRNRGTSGKPLSALRESRGARAVTARVLCASLLVMERERTFVSTLDVD
jgi:hypothetical protein